jgi:K+-sensing histidine kinase KdpD
VRPAEKTIVIASSSEVQLPEAARPPTTGPQHTAWSRLEHLYRISKILAELSNVDQTVEQVLAVIINIQPLRSAVLIHGTERYIETVVWSAKALDMQERIASKKHAMASYEYFAGVTPVLGAGRKNVIAIPLVVGRQAVFGALQLECPTTFNESDLIFLNAIANQLAVALDRHYARQREMSARAQAEEAERRMRFLAEAGKMLASSLDQQTIWESVAQLATSGDTDLCIADLCIIDLPERDKSASQRTIVLSPNLRQEIHEKDVIDALADVMSGVLKTGQSIIYPDATASHVLPLQSYMCVPLQSDGSTMGTLTVGWASPGHIYSAPDLALLHDVVLRVVLASARARLYRSTVEAIRSRDDLISIVSHDLRTPLAVILGFTNVFLRTARPGEAIGCDPQHIEAIQRSATQMTALIEDLLSTASIEANHVLIERNLNEVAPLIDEAVKLMQPLATRRDVQFNVEVADNIPPVFVDRERTMQVFANLIGNAIKFSPAGAAITIRAAQLEKDVEFSVEDRGPGIPAEQLPHIFDRFWQKPGAKRQGSGLGLFIVKGIVEAHAGKVWAKSMVGVGSTFFFTVPME